MSLRDLHYLNDLYEKAPWHALSLTPVACYD